MMNEIGNRITARKVLLVNWSRFQYVTFEMSGSTLLTGVNGTGKSTVMDAMSYLLVGNTNFNIAAQDRDRGVKAYVRGDTRSNGEDRYLRGGEISSYIAMEFYNPIEKNPLVCGVSIESVGPADPAVSKWFVFRDCLLSDVHWCDQDRQTGKMTVVPRTHLTVKGSRPKAASFMNKTTGVPQVLRALGIRTDIHRYQTKLTKMMAFRPETNIDRFIQQSVLEEDPVQSLAEIKEYRQQYYRLKEQYEDMLLERAQLEKIEDAAQIYEHRKHSLNVHELMLDYQALAAVQKEKRDIDTRIRALSQKKSALEKQTDGIERRQKAALDRVTRARNNEILTDTKGTIDELEHQKSDLMRDQSDAAARLREVKQLEEQLEETLGWEEKSIPVTDEDRNLLKRLSDAGTPAEQKAAVFLRYTEQAHWARDAYSDERTHLRDEIRDEEEHQADLYQQKNRLDSNQMVYDQRAEQAKAQVEEELERRNIHTDVFLFAELVRDIADPEWRKAIETFLGNKRFYLITEGRYALEVMKILDEKNIYWIHAVMTDRLPEDLDAVKKHSAAEQLVISNRSARRYANYLLNGIRLCDTIEELHDHPLGGLMRNGMLAKSYAVSKMDMRKTRVCLGKDAIDIQLKEVVKQIGQSKQDIARLKAKLGPVSRYVDFLNGMHLDPEAYDFDAAKKEREFARQIAELNANIDTIRDNPAFMAAMQEQTNAESEYQKVLREYSDHMTAIGQCKAVIADEEARKKENAAKEFTAKNRYQDHLTRVPGLKKEMLEEYRRVTERSGDIIAIQESTVAKQRTDLNNKIEPALRHEQQQYLKIAGRVDEFEILSGASQIPFYRKEYRSLRNVKIEEAKEQLEAKTQQLEDAFMHDFVAELKEKMDHAQDEIDGINRELKRTPFGQDTYRFEMKPRSDRAAFFNVAKRLDDYKDQPELMMAMEQGNTQLDRDIQEFMSVILSDEEEEEYTDYRRYFSYDMRIVSRQGDKNIEAELSRKQGSASGGEKQTPYFIILAASLMQCYPRETCCERLAFIDEAFSALSRERIEQMVKYLEESHFQVIYAAPPEKIESIGSHIDTTVSLVTKGRYTFAIDGMRV